MVWSTTHRPAPASGYRYREARAPRLHTGTRLHRTQVQL